VALIDRFHAAHEKRFTYQLPNAVQVVNAHLVARVEVLKPALLQRNASGADLATALRGSRSVDFDRHGVHEAEIYDGLALEPGMTFQGPAVIQEPAVTLVVPPGHSVSVDHLGNYRVGIKTQED
jgi:N-methylhydantoinase A